MDITRGAISQRVCASKFENLLKTWRTEQGVCFIGYPVFSTIDGRVPIDALMVSPNKGIIIVNFVEGTRLPDNYRERMDDAYNKLKSRLYGCKALVRGRELTVAINVVTFAPAVSVRGQIDSIYPVCNEESFKGFYCSLADENQFGSLYRSTISALESISALRSGAKKRDVKKSDSRGNVLKKLEDSIATLDHTQSRAVIETVDGVQRIRGLAGSGKTIVLALKAAYLHAQNPDWKICVTFHTRSLKEQFKRLITGFVIESSSREPDWENLKLIHAWGSGMGEKEGVYYDYCIAKGVLPMDYLHAKSQFGAEKAFAGACGAALKADTGDDGYHPFDVVLVDEAQDLPIEFLQICYRLLNDVKRLVYAYDELQSLNRLSLPPPEEIFGRRSNGEPEVVLSSPSQDIMLPVCYRNSRPVLTAAHALGFGIYRTPNPRTKTGLIQMFDDSKLWREVGYEVTAGELLDGHEVTLSRTETTSPLFLEQDIPQDDLIVFKKFDSDEEQAEWVAEEISKNINEEELRADDIMVINPDPRSTRLKVGVVRAKLIEMGIEEHLVGVDTAPDVFFTEKASVPFTGVFRAKGNEAAMVYIINAQDCYDNCMILSTVRNRLFTSMTRSKAWVRVLGVGDRMQQLIEEFEQVKTNGFKLKFTYPTAELRRQLKVINRDKSSSSVKKLQDFEGSLEQLISAIESGEIHKSDLSIELVQSLKDVLGSDEEE